MTVPLSHIAAWPWRQPPPPAPAAEQGLVAALSPGPRFGPFIGHSHVFRPQPFPGAPAFAYEGLGLVEFSPIGPSEINRNHLWPLEGAGLFSSLGLITQGVGGLSMGQFITQPLVVDQSNLSEPLTTAPDNWVGG